MSEPKIWIIGAGQMAVDYANVLSDLAIDYLVIGRGEERAVKFKTETGADVIGGGLDDFLKTKPAVPDKAIVAVNIASLSDVTNKLLKYGVGDILLEKPGVGNPDEIRDLVSNTKSSNANVVLAYNRRFYASVLKAKEIIMQDGGVTSFNFEFTEWSHEIGALKKTKTEHNHWLLGNSSHIIDTAFYLGGKPVQMNCFVKGQDKLEWHPASSIYSGAGETDSGALFSYQANWIAPGRWVIEMLTRKHRLLFKPIEQLQIQGLGSVEVKSVEGVDYALDERFKPGLHKQTSVFLKGDFSEFCNIFDQRENLQHYVKIGGYPAF